MQIHELDTYIGTPSDSDFLAVDDGTETFKIPMTSVGVTTEMTQAEAETGTGTAPRVITPAVLRSLFSAHDESTLSAVTGLFVVEDFTAADVAVAGSTATPITIAVSKSGYTPLGIVGIRKTGSGHTSAVIYQEFFDADTGNAYVGLRNIGASALTVTVVVKMLFVKS